MPARVREMLRSGLFPTVLAGSCLAATLAQEADRLPVLARFDFEKEDVAGWDFTDPKAWRVTEQSGRHALDQFRASAYEPKVRSPFNIALMPGPDVADFELTLKVKSTTRDYGHRDVCLIFGHQDPSHFYYVHLGKQADDHANSIFLVDGKPRVSIAETRTKGTPWTDDWHEVKVVRSVADGAIRVYFDDMTKPVMVAHDKTFTHGRLGVGSFDDTGMFDDITVRGVAAKAEPAK
jgi:hypothetical protein